MNPIIRKILAVIAGLAAGSAVNMGLVIVGAKIIPPPAGVDVTDVESIKSHMHLFEFKHFISPFVAHALGNPGRRFCRSNHSCCFQDDDGIGDWAFYF